MLLIGVYGNMSKPTEIEEFLLKEFFEGKSVTALVRDYLQTHEGSRKDAEKLIYNTLNKFSLKY